MPIQVLDTNIIVALAEPMGTVPNPSSFFESEAFEDLLSPGLRYSQGVTVDLTRNVAAPIVFAESMRSQKSAGLAPSRIEVHDLAAEPDVEHSVLPDLLYQIVTNLPSIHPQAIGANHEVQFRADNNETAARAIGNRVLPNEERFAPPGFHLVAGGVRYGVRGEDGVIYTVAIEPRLNNPETHNVWMSCNGNIDTTELPSVDQLLSLLSEGHRILHHALNSFFSDRL